MTAGGHGRLLELRNVRCALKEFFPDGCFSPES